MKRVLVASVLGGLLLVGTPTLASSADRHDSHDSGRRRATAATRARRPPAATTTVDRDGDSRDGDGHHRHGRHGYGYYGGPYYGGYDDCYYDRSGYYDVRAVRRRLRPGRLQRPLHLRERRPQLLRPPAQRPQRPVRRPEGGRQRRPARHGGDPGPGLQPGRDQRPGR